MACVSYAKNKYDNINIERVFNPIRSFHGNKFWNTSRKDKLT